MTSSKKERAKSVIICGVMVLYIVMLLFLMLFSFNGAVRVELRGINLVPFRSIIDFLPYLFSGLGSLPFVNLLGNVVMFMPLGFYAITLRKDKRILTNLLCVFLFSLSAEIIQYVFARGISDIDDILLNCLGGLLGIFIYKVLSLLLKNEAKVRTTIAFVSAIALPLILALLWGSARTYISYIS